MHWFKNIKCFPSSMLDIVIPNNNEQELFAMAHRLGYKQLLLLYQKPTPLQQTELPLKIMTGVIVTKPNQHYPNTITVARSSTQDRAFLEQKPPTLMYDFEQTQNPDTMHHRMSGLNQVLCTLAAGKTSVFFSFHSIFTAQHTPKILGRIMQNIRLCRKYKVHMGIASFATDPFHMRSSHDLKSYFTLLGMRADEVKKAFALS